MIIQRLLAGLLAVSLSAGVCAMASGSRVYSIEELFSIAETNSRQLRPALTAEEVARKDIAVAKSARLPEIDASLSLSYLGDGFTLNRSFSDYQKAPIPHLGNGLSLSISQPLYSGGAISSAIDLASLRAEAAGHEAQLNRDNIRMNIAALYLDLFKCRNLRMVVEKNIAQARKVLDEMKARHEQGVALRNDITRYELLLSNLELQLIKIDNTLTILNRNLCLTVGLPDDTTLLPDTTLLARSLPSGPEESWQAEAATNAPALRLDRSGVAISRKAEDIVKSDRLPKIGLQAAWSIDGPILTEVPPIDRNLSYWYVGLGVSYNLSSLYKTNKALAHSRAATREAQERLEATEERVALEVNSCYVRYLEAYEELRTQEKSVELAERNYSTVSTRYSEGMALITDLLDAANARLDAQQQLVNARINIIYSYYKLLFTSGTI